MTTTEPLQVLTPGIGYGIVVGIGGFFTLLMLLLTYLQNKFTAYSTHGAEEFTTASRSVKPGLIAAGIVSSWSKSFLFVSKVMARGEKEKALKSWKIT